MGKEKVKRKLKVNIDNKDKAKRITVKTSPFKSKRPNAPLGVGGGSSFNYDNPEELKKCETDNFIENFFQMNKSLSTFYEGDYTNEISEFIPIPSLQKIIRTYRLMNKIGKEKYIGDEDLEKPTAGWSFKQVKKICTIIDKLEKKSYLSKSDASKIKELLVVRTRLSNKGLSFLMNNLNPQTGKVGRPKDISYDALIYCIRKRIEKVTGKPNYNLIINFLKEQDIIDFKNKDIAINEERLRKRYKRIIFDVLKEEYDKLRIAFLGTLFLRLEMPSYDAEIADRFIPPLDNFLVI